MANGRFGGGDGTVANPFLVEDAEDLKAVEQNLTAQYKQTADIVLQAGWEPIGLVFQGTYDGDLHTIEFSGAQTTLFDVLHGAVVKNVGLEHVVVPETVTCESGLAQESHDTEFENCFVSGHTQDERLEVIVANHTDGDEDDWICRTRHPFYKEKDLRSSKQKRKGSGSCLQNPCSGCPATSMAENLEER